METILLTGGLGYIGSLTCLELLSLKYKVIIFDSLINSSIESLRRIKTLGSYSKDYCPNNLIFIKGDIRNYNDLNKTFKDARDNENKINAVVHMAGLKSVFDSQKNPDLYKDVNLYGTEILLKVMEENQCYSIIFSSSATVYGENDQEFLTEKHKCRPNNNYGQTKLEVEKILEQKYHHSNKKWKIINLRYFNPIGAHPSGMLGEQNLNSSHNLFPLLCKAASNNKIFKIFGNDWNTPDRTAIRDFVHVMDIAEGHSCALEYIKKNESLNLSINLGSGQGTSILEFINVFQQTLNIKLDYKFIERREGDVSRYVASNQLAKELLKWEPIYSLKEMCLDGWKWYISNKNI